MEKGEEVIISRRWGDFMRGVIGAVGGSQLLGECSDKGTAAVALRVFLGFAMAMVQRRTHTHTH